MSNSKKEALPQVSLQDLSDWRSNPVTKIFYSILQDDKQNILENWRVRGYMGENESHTMQLTLDALGSLGALDTITDHIDHIEEKIDLYNKEVIANA